MSTGIEVKNYKLKALPSKPIPNAILYVKADSDTEVSTYITDVNGVPHALKDDGSIVNPGVQTVFNTDGSISVVGTENVKVSLQSGLVSLINSAIQPGDLSNTKAEFNAQLTDGDFLFVGDVSNYTDEQAQDAVGNTLTDTTTIDFIYNDATPSISATVKPNSITSAELANNIDLTEFVNNAGFETTSQLNIRDTNNRNRVNHTGTQAISTIVNLQSSLDAKENKAEKNVANGYAGLGSDGKLFNNQLPALAITDTFVVNSQSAMLALSLAETGDVAVRTDLNKTYILKGTNPSILGDWQELLTPTDSVSSVFGRTGNVVANSGDYNTSLVPDTLDKRYVTDANLVTIGNQSGVNTGDETTATIQAKRPIKTINSISLEGAGNAIISTNNVPNSSVVSGTTTSDALNTLNTSKADDSNVIHKTLNETKVGTLSLITPDIASGTSGLNAISPVVIQGGKGGDNTNTAGSVTAGNASNINIKTGAGGAVTGVTGTGFSGKGGDIMIVAGDGGIATGSGTLFPGNAGTALLQGGNSKGGVAGTAELKAGNNDKLLALGGNVHIVAGWGNQDNNSNPLYDGTIFIGCSAAQVVRGNSVFGDTIDNRVDRIQVTGTGLFTGTVKASPAISNDQLVTLGQLLSILDGNRNQGVTTLSLDGTSSVYNIPHGLGVVPTFAFAGRGNSLNFDVFNTTWDITNIIITYQNPPLAGSLNINWIALK